MSQMAQIMTMRTALYRHYNAKGELLYVGVSLSPMARTSKHAQSSDWFNDVVRIDIDWHNDRKSALEAEKALIKAENPFFNIDHNLKRVADPENIKTTGEIITQAGGAVAVAQRIGISSAGVRAMAYRVLPAAWYFALCDMTGQTLPRHLFSFKGL